MQLPKLPACHSLQLIAGIVVAAVVVAAAAVVVVIIVVAVIKQIPFWHLFFTLSSAKFAYFNII